VNEVHDNGYYHVRASVVTIGPTRWHEVEENSVRSSAIRNVGDDFINTPALYLHNLHVNSQGDDNAPERHLYGFDVTYRDVFSVDARQATAMAKTLKIINRRMGKLRERFGHPDSIGQYLGHVAVAIGASAIIVPQGPTRGWSYDEIDHRVMTVGEGVTYVNHVVAKWAAREPVVV
jgi:hypothetical protein